MLGCTLAAHQVLFVNANDFRVTPVGCRTGDFEEVVRPGVSLVLTSGGAVAGADVVRGKESGYAVDLKAPERFVAGLLSGHRSTA